MKRYFILLLFAYAALLGIISCSKTDEKDLILGQWKRVKEETYTNGQLVSSKDVDYQYRMFFTSSGECIEEFYHSTYSITDKWLTLQFESHAEIYKIQKITHKELILVESDYDSEEWWYYKRIE